MEKLVSGRLVDGSQAHSRTPPNILEVPGRSPNLHCSAPAMGWLGGVLPHHALRRRPFGGCEIVGANSTCSRRWTRVLSTGALLVSSGGGTEDWGELFEKTVRRQPLARRTQASGKLHGAQGEVQAVP